MRAPPAATPFRDDCEGWIRLKLQAGIPLDATEKAYLASLPLDDPLHHALPVPRKATIQQG